MATRPAACNCGQLRLEASGDPIRISMCHCLACQRRTGSAFSIQARFHSDQVEIVGQSSSYVRISDDMEREAAFFFCPECGATVYYTGSDQPELVAVPVGAFADPRFPPPTVSVFESRRHLWLELPDGIEHHQD
ncbi:MAG: GFA family protein [Thermoleophilia bacterium]|nr:GFA family protein [Thermoleophilia bacterium]